VSKASRDKGQRRERQIVEMLRVLGIRSERVPLSGAAVFRNTRSTDVDYYPFGSDAVPWVSEVKARGNGEGFATIKRWLADADTLFLIEDHQKPLVVLPWSRFADLLLALKSPIRVTPAMQAMIDEAAASVDEAA
jgi:hypothetical protein